VFAEVSQCSVALIFISHTWSEWQVSLFYPRMGKRERSLILPRVRVCLSSVRVSFLIVDQVTYQNEQNKVLKYDFFSAQVTITM